MTVRDLMKQHGIQFERRDYHDGMFLSYAGKISKFAFLCTYRHQAYEAFVWLLEEAGCFESWEMVGGVGAYMRHNQIQDRERGEREYQAMKECAEKLRDFFGREVYHDLIASER